MTPTPPPNSQWQRPQQSLSIASWWRRWYDFVVRSVLRLNDHPHRIALGLAVGVFVAFTPTIGLQMPICVALAWVLGANKVVGLPVVWISNPATFVPIYYPSYLLGCQIAKCPSVDRAWFASLSPAPDDSTVDILGTLGSRFIDIALPLWIGCLAVATVLAIVTYVVSFFAIRMYRKEESMALEQLASRRPEASDG